MKPLSELLPEMLDMVTITEPDVVVGTRADLEQMVADLRHAGYSDLTIGAVMMSGCLFSHHNTGTDDWLYSCKVLKVLEGVL